MYRPGLLTTISTPGDEGKHVRYTIEDRRQFNFEVRSCHGALLSFATFVNDAEESVVEVGLGVENNEKSFIQIAGSSSFETSTPNLLHCDDMRAFWISWDDEYIKVGRGSLVDEQIFMNLRDPNRDSFNAIIIHSIKSSSAVWQVFENSGVMVIVDTPNEHKYERIWKEVADRQFWTFMVRAGGDVHVVLTEQYGVTETNIYEFVVGGWYNNRSVIRTDVLGGGDSIKDSLDAKNLVSSSERREFWISWWKGQLELGQGGVYAVNRLLKWKDEAPRNIRYLSVSTGFGNTGRWWIRDERESTTYLFTQPTTSNEPQAKYNSNWLSTPRQEFITFVVKACKDASILLSDSHTINPELAYEIIIGAEENTKVVIRELYNDGNLAETESTFILSCTEQRAFWLSWHNGTARIGFGLVYSVNVILEKQLYEAVEGSYRVNALGLATPTTPGEWRVRESAVERIIIYTPSEFNEFGFVWRTIYQQEFFTFRVTACSDCHVALSPTIGVDYDETYLDMIISGWGNTQSLISKVIGPDGAREDFSAAVSTPQLLNCTNNIDIWISWNSMKIRMGRGMLPGYHILLDHPLSEPIIVKAVSLSTGWGHTGQFVIEEDLGDYFLFYVGIHESIRWVELANYITWFPLKIRACTEVNVYLCSQLSVVEGCYTLTIGAQNNTKSTLYDGDIVLVEAETLDLLSCNDNRDIWFQWDKRANLNIGRGTIPGFNTFIAYTEVDREILAYGFESRSDDYSSRFQIYHNTMVSITFYTPDFFSYEQVWESVDHRRSLVFGVTACSDVHVVLSTNTRNFSTGMIEIVIGGWTNTKSVIRIVDDRHYAEVETPSILHCTESRFFWITWQYGAIEAGKGEIAGKERFIDYQPLELYDIRSVGYSTGYGSDGSWFIIGTGAIPTDTPMTEVPMPTDAASTDSSSGLSQDAVAGIVIGTIGGFLLLVLIAMYIYDRRTEVTNQTSLPKKEDRENDQKTVVNETSGTVSPADDAPSMVETIVSSSTEANQS